MKILNYILFIIFFSFNSWTELILVEQSEGNIKPIDFDQAEERTKVELADIYKNILNRYQFPMLTMYYALENEETKQIIDKLLMPNNGDFPEQNLVNHFISQKYGDRYRAVYVPTTLFEASAIISIFQDIDNQESFIEKEDEKDPRLFAYFRQDFSNDLVKSFWNYLNKIADKTDLVKDQRRADFLRSTYGVHNLSDQVMRLWFKAVYDLVNTTADDLIDKSWEGALEKIFNKFDGLRDDIKNIVKTKASILSLPFLNNFDQHVDNIFKQDDQRDVLKRYAQLESDMAKKAKFMLVRGTQGLKLNDQQTLLDLPYLELKEDFDGLVGQNQQVSQLIQQKTGLLNPKAIEEILRIKTLRDVGNTFKPKSLSFSNSLLAGTINDLGKTGARAYDYIGKENDSFGYIIPITIYEYLNNDVIKDAFFISPLNSLVGLLAAGEFFHSRSKVSLFHPQKSWAGYISGVASDSQIISSDFSLGVYAFSAPSKDWTTLAGHISDLIAHRALLITKGSEVTTTDEQLKESQRSASAFVQSLNKLQDGDLKDIGEIDTKNPETWAKTSIVETIVRKMMVAKGLSVFGAKDPRFYNSNNHFYRLAKNPKESQTGLVLDNDRIFVIRDLRPRVKVHLLAIPKGNYISLPHFASHADEQEIEDLFRAIAETADKQNLVETGFRIITNHAMKPGQAINHAHQEIAHLHVHIAGGECLGRPVVGQKSPNYESEAYELFDVDAWLKRLKNKISSLAAETSFEHSSVYKKDDINEIQNLAERVNIDPSSFLFKSSSAFMGVDDFKPWGIGLSTSEFIALIKRYQIMAQSLDEENRLVIYKVPNYASEQIPILLGATILNSNDQPTYNSIYDFAKLAPKEHLSATIRLLTTVAAVLGIDKTGYRLVANHGANAWQIPKAMMQLFLAGGAPLGITVTNLMGNKMPKNMDEEEADYADLNLMPHVDCPSDPALALQLGGEINEVLARNDSTEQQITELQAKLPKLKDRIDKFKSDTNDVPSTEIIGEKLRLKIVNFRDAKFRQLASELNGIWEQYINFSKSFKAKRPFSAEEAKKYTTNMYKLSGKITEVSDSLKKYEPTNLINVSSLAYNLRLANKDFYVFIDLDDTLTKGIDSTELTESDLLNIIKRLQNAGINVLALTNRHYWPTMPKEGTSGHKNTFTLLKEIDKEFAFSNPGNLKEGLLYKQDKEPGRGIRYFKDGVIFCADDFAGKGYCLSNYLYRLAEETDESLPNQIWFFDDNIEKVKEVIDVMQEIKMPIQGFHYEPR